MTKAQQIVSEVAREYEVRVSRLMSRATTPRVVRARDEAMARIRAKLAWSSTEIGEFFDRDHATVLRAVGRHRAAPATPVAQRKPDVAPADLANALQDRIHAASGGLISSSPVFRDQRRPAREVPTGKRVVPIRLDPFVRALADRWWDYGEGDDHWGVLTGALSEMLAIEADRRGEP